jgi:hypothetical protein
MTAAAIRAARWREKQKQADPDFAKHEADRKASERAETARLEEIDDTLKKNPSNRHNSPFVMTEAPHGLGMLVTGGYGPNQIDFVAAARATKGMRRVKPKGWGIGIEKRKPNDLPLEFEDTFAPVFRKSKAVRILHQFIYENTKSSPMLVCLSCGDQIGSGEDPGSNIEAGYHHFRLRHPALFEIFATRLASKIGCPEDHDGMTKRHGGGTLRLECKRCRKLLYKPPK